MRGDCGDEHCPGWVGRDEVMRCDDCRTVRDDLAAVVAALEHARELRQPGRYDRHGRTTNGILMACVRTLLHEVHGRAEGAAAADAIERVRNGVV